VITALHLKRNRCYLRTIVVVLLVSWLSLLVSATCIMPMPTLFAAKAAPSMDACIHDHAAESAPQHPEDCSLKPCLNAANDSLTDSNRLLQPDMPVFLFTMAWVFLTLLFFYAPLSIPRKADPPLGRRILLIYQFCKLLN